MVKATCQVCNKSFRTTMGCWSHYYDEHVLTKYFCRHCGIEINILSISAKEHLKTHFLDDVKLNGKEGGKNG